MNYESEALIFYHDDPDENVKNLSYFLQNKLSQNSLGSNSKLIIIIISIITYYSPCR